MTTQNSNCPHINLLFEIRASSFVQTANCERIKKSRERAMTYNKVLS